MMKETDRRDLYQRALIKWRLPKRIMEKPTHHDVRRVGSTRILRKVIFESDHIVFKRQLQCILVNGGYPKRDIALNSERAPIFSFFIFLILDGFEIRLSPNPNPNLGYTQNHAP